jgi:hypothetical protein
MNTAGSGRARALYFGLGLFWAWRAYLVKSGYVGPGLLVYLVKARARDSTRISPNLLVVDN